MRQLHRDALTLADGFVKDLDASDLPRPTPCAGWSLGELLAHMIGQHRGFAQAVREGDAPAEAYQPVPFDLAAWQSSVTELASSFAAADLDASAIAVELAPIPLPLAQLVAAQLIDTVVHTWDVCQAVGIQFTPPADLLAVTAAIAAAIPDGAYGPGRAFAPRLPERGASWPDTLARVGRRVGAPTVSSKE